MTNYDLPAALKNYRLQHKLSLSQMGKKLNTSKSSYNRLEKGIRKPYHDELVTIVRQLELNVDPRDIPSIPKPVPKWYQSRKMHWIIPILIATVVQTMFLELRGFRESFGEDAIEAGEHVKPMFKVGALFCAIYWYFWRPEWPKRKPTLLEVGYGFAVVSVYLILLFHEELSLTIMKGASPYVPAISARPGIVLTVTAASLSLFLWSFKKTIFLSMPNSRTTP